MNKYIFQICLEIVLNDHNYSENSILHWPHWTFASPFFLRITRLFVLSNDARRHANKGTQQIGNTACSLLWVAIMIWRKADGLKTIDLVCSKNLWSKDMKSARSLVSTLLYRWKARVGDHAPMIILKYFEAVHLTTICRPTLRFVDTVLWQLVAYNWYHINWTQKIAPVLPGEKQSTNWPIRKETMRYVSCLMSQKATTLH